MRSIPNLTALLIAILLTTASANALEMTERQVKIGKELSMSAAEKVADQLFKMDAASHEEPILLVISTRAGYAPAAMVVVDAVQAVQAPVYAVIQAEAFGVGAIVAVFCDKVYAFGHASVLFNQLEYDSEKVMTENPPLPVEAAKAYIERIWQAVARRLKLDPDELIQKSTGGWYLTAVEAKRVGVVTDLIERVQWIDLVVETVEIKRTTTVKHKQPIQGQSP